MDKEMGLTAVISGSFKFKPEIDRSHEAFADHDVMVLAPDTGWFWVPRLVIATDMNAIRPLPTERHLPLEAIEEQFLRHLDRADFVYLMNIGGYLGNSTAFELGYAIASQKPVYAIEALDETFLTGYSAEDRMLIEDAVHVMPIEEVSRHFREHYLR